MAADISVTAAQVAPVFEKFGKSEIYTGVAAATITAGQALYIVAATGLLNLADANTGAGDNEAQFRGIALNGGGAGQAIDYIMHGCVYGFDLSSENYDAIMYLSDTAGALNDTANGTNNVPCGRVFPLADTNTDGEPTKVLLVDVPIAHADWSG